jgi:RsiW-degrading membrane proteinase PrsW (M82 family)
MSDLPVRDEIAPFLERDVRRAVVSMWEPAFATLAFVFFPMFAPRTIAAIEWDFGLYFGFLVLFALRAYVHSRKSWPTILFFALFTAALLVFGFFDVYASLLRGIFGLGTADPCRSTPHDLAIFPGCTVGVGMVEESFKALPLLAALALGALVWRRAPGPKLFRALSLRAPGDGLVLGCAVGVAFTLIETILQYVSDATHHQGDAFGLAAELIRLPSTFFGHVAWTAYFGFVLGEALLERNRIRSVAIPCAAFLIVAALHGAWDAFNDNIFVLTPIALVSMAIFYSAAVTVRRAAPEAVVVVPVPAASPAPG